MFDMETVECLYNYRSATDRRLALKFIIYKSNRQACRTRRVFLCLVIALRTNGITKSKASNTQTDDGYKKIRPDVFVPGITRMTAFCRYLLYRHSSHNREFHNVNCRFCGAVHSVDRAYISVLSQVIHSVNERKRCRQI